MLLPEIPLERRLGWFSSCRKDLSPLLVAIFLSRTQKWAIKSICILGKFLALHQVQPSPFLPSSFSLSWPFPRENFPRVRFLGWCWNSCAVKGVEAPSLGSFTNHCNTPQKAQSGWVRQPCQKGGQPYLSLMFLTLEKNHLVKVSDPFLFFKHWIILNFDIWEAQKY